MKVFEEKVLDGLKVALACLGTGLDDCGTLGVAVSGGADSVSLLCSLKKALPENIALKAVTVNHNIRPESETCGDADYVVSLCESLEIPCRRYEIERGLVEKKSGKESNGIEDSARRLRYELFRQFIADEKIDFLCLAHNKNDQEETVLMRVLQGSGDLSGIPRAREKYVRPLLDVCRDEIEDYLSEMKIPYRTDSTNLENDMMRNRIRNVLVPVLDENFGGWRKAVENLSVKSGHDNSALDGISDCAMKNIGYEKKGGAVTFSSKDFFILQDAIRHRIVMKAVKDVGASERIPQAFLRRWCDESYIAQKKKECSSGIEFCLAGGVLTVEKKTKVATEDGFFAIIEKPGAFFAGGKSFDAERAAGGISIASGEKKILLGGIDFPFAFRSRQPGDEVKSSGGTMRSLSKILDGWKANELKDRIPVIQQMERTSQNIKCIWGSLYGFNDWIVVD